MAPEKTPDSADDDRHDTSADAPTGGGPRIIDSAELLQGQREVWIEHGKEMYRLRLTAAGRLYLTK